MRGLGIAKRILLNMPDSLNELTNVVHALVTLLMADSDDATVVDRWDDLEETLRTRTWEIFRRHRRGRLEEAHAAERAATLARCSLVQAQAAPAAASTKESA